MIDDVLGRGWSFPVTADETGEAQLADGAEDVRQAVLLVLSTEPGERVMRPDFGCGLRQFVFRTVNTTTTALLRDQVQASLTTWEPRIVVDEVAVTPDPAEHGLVHVSVGYRIRATNTFYNLVHPYYLREARQ